MGKIYCEICKKKCKGNVLKLDEKFMHKDCFKCNVCRKSLETGGFFCKDGRYYCTEDYQRTYGVQCGMCNKYADGEIVTILGGTFHIHCFKCQNCSTPFNCGDKATLWGNSYLCERCSSIKQEKENVCPSNSTVKPYSQSDIVQQTREFPVQSAIVSQNIVNTHYVDSSDTETSLRPKPIECLQLHIDNGYTSTDSGVEKTKSEMGYLSQHSPCYSMTSGDESWIHSSRGRKPGRFQSHNYQFGRHINESYLKIMERTLKQTPPRANYGVRNMVSLNDPKYSHYHRPEKFSYRSSPNIHMKKGMSLLVNHTTPGYLTQKERFSLKFGSTMRPQSSIDLNITEEVKRLSHYPDAREPDKDYQPPIDRYDFPAPPSLSVIMQDLKKEKASKRSAASTGDIRSDMSGTDTTMEIADITESEDERVRRQKREKQIRELRLMKKGSGISQTVLDQLEKVTDPAKLDVDFDPISLSRSPDAATEPHQKPRYERHTFTSPSRDSRFEGRPMHSLSYRMQYSCTGGRTGTLSGYTSTAQPGYTQGYMSCGECSTEGRPNSSLSIRALSLPRPPNVYSTQVSTQMNGHMSPSTTTLGYSMDATSHSIDESTLIGGSGIISSQMPRDGYMSDMGPSSAVPRRSRPEFGYDSDYEALYKTPFPTVQSYLRPSNYLKTKDKVPPQIFPYELLKISNFALPKGTDRSKLETHLSDQDFELVFQMSRYAFNRLPEWKRNDLKQKVDLY